LVWQRQVVERHSVSFGQCLHTSPINRTCRLGTDQSHWSWHLHVSLQSRYIVTPRSLEKFLIFERVRCLEEKVIAILSPVSPCYTKLDWAHISLHVLKTPYMCVFNDVLVCCCDHLFIWNDVGKWQMVKALKEAPEIVVATPGRMIDMLLSGTTNMQRCTMAVIDG
jgi:hypothetical protein